MHFFYEYNKVRHAVSKTVTTECPHKTKGYGKRRIPPIMLPPSYVCGRYDQ